MLRSERRVVITGLGVVSPIGIGPEPVWSALVGGHGGVGPIETFPTAGLPTMAIYCSRAWIRLDSAVRKSPSANASRDCDCATSVRVRSPIWNRSRVACKLTFNISTLARPTRTTSDVRMTSI